MSLSRHDTSPNDVMNAIFDKIAGNRDCNSRKVQRGLLARCLDDSERRDLLVYLSSTKKVAMIDIELGIKNVSCGLAIQLEKKRVKARQSSLAPAFTAR